MVKNVSLSLFFRSYSTSGNVCACLHRIFISIFVSVGVKLLCLNDFLMLKCAIECMQRLDLDDGLT